eukprot:11383590-Alexandrium_andersonii.AAC.1
MIGEVPAPARRGLHAVGSLGIDKDTVDRGFAISLSSTSCRPSRAERNEASADGPLFDGDGQADL